MKKKLISLAIVGAMAIPATSNAFEVLGKKLEIYGKAHVSVDYADNDKVGAANQKDFSLSSNSSRIGFKGEYGLENGMSILYQVEQEIQLDSGSGTWATRNSFVGLKGGFGTVLAGYHDTPFKDVGSKWGMFGDTVGDRRAVLGASATSGNKMNQRGKNALLYKNTFGGLQLNAMYSADGADSAKGALDNNKKDMYSLALMYKQGPLFLAAGYENWKDLAGNLGKVKGYRVAGSYKIGAAKLGLIYENITSNATLTLDRDVWGINGAVKLSKAASVKAQYLSAGDYKGTSNSGANMASIGVFNKLDKHAKVYAAYTRTSNDANAKYQGVDGGHGDEVKTDLGGSPSAFSVGFMYKF